MEALEDRGLYRVVIEQSVILDGWAHIWDLSTTNDETTKKIIKGLKQDLQAGEIELVAVDDDVYDFPEYDFVRKNGG